MGHLGRLCGSVAGLLRWERGGGTFQLLGVSFPGAMEMRLVVWVGGDLEGWSSGVPRGGLRLGWLVVALCRGCSVLGPPGVHACRQLLAGLSLGLWSLLEGAFLSGPFGCHYAGGRFRALLGTAVYRTLNSPWSSFMITSS